MNKINQAVSIKRKNLIQSYIKVKLTEFYDSIDMEEKKTLNIIPGFQIE